MTHNKLDKYTTGHTPAAVYLIDCLNNSNNRLDKNVLKSITQFKEIFNQLVRAYHSNNIDAKVVEAFIVAKKLSLELDCDKLLKAGYTPLVVKLYSNIITADMRDFSRKHQLIAKISKSAIDRVKAQCRNSNIEYKGQSIKTVSFGIEVTVHFDKFGEASVDMDKKQIPSTITAHTLTLKSRSRLQKLGRVYHI